MTITTRRIAYAGVMVLAAMAISRATQFRFQEQEQAFRRACSDQLKKLGITRGAAKAKYPTPEILMVSGGCLAPGATGEVAVKGRFAPDTKFIFENDNVEVVKESLAASEYRATLKIAPDIGPQTASVMAITPRDRHHGAERRRCDRRAIRVEPGSGERLENHGAFAREQSLRRPAGARDVCHGILPSGRGGRLRKA